MCALLKNKTVAVTGASGFIGSHIVEALCRDTYRSLNVEVHALGRSRGKLELLQSREGYHFHACDLLSANRLREILLDVQPQILIHLASASDGRESIEQSKLTLATNVTGTLNLLDAFREVERAEGLIYGDSTKSYGSEPAPYHAGTRQAPNSAYSITKAAAWDFVKLHAAQFGFSAVAIRPTLVYGSRQPLNLISALLDAILERREEFRLLGGLQTRSPLHIDDAVEAYLTAADAVNAVHSKVINIGGPEELNVRRIAECVVRTAGSAMRIVQDDVMRETDVSRSAVDLSEAQALLGWLPKIRLHVGVQRLLNEVRPDVSLRMGMAK